jgi:hypothetical protein
MKANEVIASALSLLRLDGVSGLLLQKGSYRIANQLPYSETKTANLSLVLQNLADGYRGVKRDVRLLWFEFDGGRLLILQQFGTQLLLLLGRKADPDIVSGAAAAFFSEHSTQIAMLPSEAAEFDLGRQSQVEELFVTNPRLTEAIRAKAEATISVWPEARQAIERSLRKVLGAAQAGRLIDRCIERSPGLDPYQMTRADLRKLVSQVLAQVPNTGKRSALELELEPQLEALSL